MPDITFYIRISLEILTIVAFTMLLSFYVYQSRNRPLVKNRYFVAAIIAGLIAMIAFTFDTLLVEFVKNSPTGQPTDPDRVAIITTLIIFFFFFSLFFLFLYFHYGTITNSKTPKILLIIFSIVLLLEIFIVLTYIFRLYPAIAVPIANLFPDSLISKFFTNNFYTLPQNETEYLNITGRIISWLSHTEQILGTIASGAIMYLIVRRNKELIIEEKSSYVELFGIATLFISQTIFLAENLSATFLNVGEPNIVTIAIFFIFIGLLLFIGNYLLFEPPDILQPEMQVGYAYFDRLKDKFSNSTPEKEKISKRHLNRTSLNILLYLLEKEDVVDQKTMLISLHLKPEILKHQMQLLGNIGEEKSLIEVSSDNQEKSDQRIILSNEGKIFLRELFNQLQGYFKSVLFDKGEDDPPIGLVERFKRWFNRNGEFLTGSMGSVAVITTISTVYISQPEPSLINIPLTIAAIVIGGAAVLGLILMLRRKGYLKTQLIKEKRQLDELEFSTVVKNLEKEFKDYSDISK